MQFIGAQPTVDLTYSDVFLVPRSSAVASRLEVDLTPDDGTPATIPLVAANMNSVTGPRLAATLARRGGLGVLPQDFSIEHTLFAVQAIKQWPIACDLPFMLGPDSTAADALRQLPPVPGHGVLVVDMRKPAPDENPLAPRRERVHGLLSAERLATAPPDARLGDLIHSAPRVIELAELGEGREAFDAVHAIEAREHGEELMGVIDGDRFLGTVDWRSTLRNALYRPAIDERGRLAVAAAVGINGDVAGKARALADAGVDVLVLDTAHGHQEGMIRAIETVAAQGLGLPIVAGNVVTADGVRDLVAAGATIIKVGVGPGAMCTTRMMTAVGRPQFSAVLEAAQAARELGAHVWADGGVRYPRDVALALAAGAESVMIGSWFAGTIEAPGELRVDAQGRHYKESWGMASTKAVQQRFAGLDAYEQARKALFAEGISDSKIYLDPQRPGVEDLVDMITSGVRSSFTYAGAATLSEFHVRAHVGLQSAAGYEEGKALPVSW